MNALCYGVGQKRAAEGRFLITVMFTTREATLSALRRASLMAAGMKPKIALIDVIPFHFPFDRPPASVQFHRDRLRDLITEADIEDCEAAANVVLCTDQLACIKEILPPHSFVVIGGHRSWNSPEVHLERLLVALGHEVVFFENNIRENELGAMFGRISRATHRLISYCIRR